MLFGIPSRCTAFLLAGALVCGLVGCSLFPDPGHSSGSGSGGSSTSASLPSGSASGSFEPGEHAPVPAVPAPSPKPDQSNPEQNHISGSEAASSQGESPFVPVIHPFVPVPSSYDFSQPVPASTAVDNSYFADAAFVGDSRTDGLLIFSGIGCGTNLTSNGLSIFQLAEKKALTIGGQKYTLLEALAMKQYGKVYISLGVNELGVYDDEGFYRSYCAAIDKIRACQPNAVIYIQGLIPLNEGVIAQTIKRDYLTNEHLIVYNNIMKRVAQEKQVAFLDLHTEFLDENGELPANASNDGVHLLRDGYKKWLSYLKTHTVSYDALYHSQPVQPEVPAPVDPPVQPADPVPVDPPVQPTDPAPVDPPVQPADPVPVDPPADVSVESPSESPMEGPAAEQPKEGSVA